MRAQRIASLLIATTVGCSSAVPRDGTMPVAEWERVLAAEDARAAAPADVRTLRAALASEHETIRIMAVRALGRTERAEFRDDIAALLGDRAVGVRVAAAHALGDITRDGSSAEVRELLVGAMPPRDESPELAGAIAATLGRLRHDPAAAEAVASRLRPLLSAPGPGRAGALRGFYFLARQPNGRGPVAARAEALAQVARTDSSAHARRLAVAALSSAGAATADLLGGPAADADWGVRREAVAAAGAPSVAAVESLIRNALADPAPQVRYEAVRAYGRRLAATGGCAPIVAAVRDPNAHVAILATGLAAAEPCRATAPLMLLDSLARTLQDDEWHRAAAAILALAAVRHERAGGHVQRLARSGSPFARAYAARAAASLRDDALLRVLAADANANVRTAAVAALHEIAGRGADSIFIAQLESDDSELLQAAVRALEGTTHPDALERMLDALDRITRQQSETSRDARAALIAGIRQLGSRAHAERLRPYTRDFDAVIAERAAETLTAWTGTPVRPESRPLPRLPLPGFADVERLARSRFVLEMEDGSEIEVALMPFVAPTNAWRFARLARSGYYDGLTIHRVVPNFVVQGGSPGANEYSGDAPFTRDELGAPNLRGTVGLSTRGRDTGDAQFYINLIDNVRLDHEYTILGSVTRGMEHVDALLEGAVIRRVSERR